MQAFLFLYLIGTFLLSFFACIFLIPHVYRIGLQLNVIDKNDDRKLNNKNQVRFGGLAIIIPFYLSIFLSYIFYSFNNQLIYLNSLQFIPLMIVIVVGSLLFYALGLCDDLYTLSPFLRLFIQIILILILISFGLNIDINGFFEVISISENSNIESSLSVILTVILIAGVINSFNWIDGLDGLASGVTGIISIGYLTIGFLEGNWIIALFTASIAGSSFGFLRYNFYPSKIIMGDGGSYFIGYLNIIIGLITLCSFDNSNLLNFSIDKLYLILIILFLPIFDMLIVIVRRIKNGKSPFYPDRTHFHQLLVDKGLSHKRTVFLIYAITQWCVSLVINLNNFPNNFTLLFISSLLLITMVFFIFLKGNFLIFTKK